MTQDLIAIKLKLELLDRQFNVPPATQQSIAALLDFTQHSVDKARQQISDMKTDVAKTSITQSTLSLILLGDLYWNIKFQSIQQLMMCRFLIIWVLIYQVF